MSILGYCQDDGQRKSIHYFIFIFFFFLLSINQFRSRIELPPPKKRSKQQIKRQKEKRWAASENPISNSDTARVRMTWNRFAIADYTRQTVRAYKIGIYILAPSVAVRRNSCQRFAISNLVYIYIYICSPLLFLFMAGDICIK